METEGSFDWNTGRLDSECSLPFYEQLAEFIRKKIDTGELLVGEQLPSSRKLQQYFHLSSNSVNSAIRLLVRDGYLVRHPRLGTFVMGKFDSENKQNSQLPPLLSIITGTPPKKKPLPFHAMIYNECHRIFTPRNWRVKWSFPHEGEGMYYLCQKIISEDQPQAVLLAGFSYTKAITTEFNKAGIPVVAIGIPEDRQNVPYVDNDHYAGMKDVVKKLLLAGHRNILLVDCDSGNYNACQDRRRGYIDAYTAQKQIPDARLLIQLHQSTESPAEFLHEMKLLNRYPITYSAVIVYSRNLQRFMLQYLKARQKSIPKDISFFAYGVENTDAFFDSASWDIKELVIQAAQMLLTFPQKTEKKIFPVFLHNGESISYQNNKEDK